MHCFLALILRCCLALICCAALAARVLKVEVEHREPARSVSYEVLSGHFFGGFDPADPCNAIINDLSLAPKNAPGLAAYSATFRLLLPVEVAKISGGLIPMLVPRTDADGNETAGIPSVLQRAPLGTYLGWNVTATGYLKGRACGFAGCFIPFRRTKAERTAPGDPRLSLEERHGAHAAYVERVKAATKELVGERFLLPDDAARLIAEAEDGDVLR